MSASPGSDPRTRISVVGSFANVSEAQDAVGRMEEAGVEPGAIVVAGGGSPMARPADPAEGRFLWRLALIVVFWSMVGAGIGVVMALVFAAVGIPPGGTTGLAVHIATWAIFAHLIAGMWAGYALLTRGESREPVTRIADGRALVRVYCDPTLGGEMRELLLEAGASNVATYAPDGRLVAPRS